MKSIFNILLLSFIAGIILSCNKDDNAPIIFTGEVVFVKTYGGSDLDDAVKIVQATDGNYLVLGTTKSIDGDITDKTTTDSDFWLLKLTPTGDKVWSKTYGGSKDETATSISKTRDGGYILSGYSRSSDGDVSGNEGFHDFWILKIDANGNKQWDRNYGFSGSDQAFKAFETSSGGFFITGFFDVSASGGLGNDNGRGTRHGVGEYWGILLDANGNRVWRRFFGGTNNDRSYDALETNDGGFLMVGASESGDFDITDTKGSYDFWAVRLDASGNKLWTKSFGGSEIDIGYAVTKTADGNYILVGDTRSSDQDISNLKGNADAWVVKFNDTDGGIIWEKTYGGTEFESARSISALSNGNFLISGSTRSPNGDVSNNNGQNDAWAFIITPNGSLQFEQAVGGTNLDFANDAIETNDNTLIVVGNTESNDIDIPLNRGSKDVIIIKLK